MQHLLLLNAQTKHEQNKTAKLGDQIINDPGTRENIKTRQKRALTLYFQVAEQREKRCSSISKREIERRSTLFHRKYVSFSA